MKTKFVCFGNRTYELKVIDQSEHSIGAISANIYDLADNLVYEGDSIHYEVDVCIAETTSEFEDHLDKEECAHGFYINRGGRCPHCDREEWADIKYHSMKEDGLI